MKHIRKVLSALIFLIDFNVVIPYLIGIIMDSRFFLPVRILIVISVSIAGFLPFLYINLFPSLTIRRTSTKRNKVLEDGIALLQIFLATTIAESTLIILSLLFLRPHASDGFAQIVSYLSALLLFVLMESILFWNGIIRVYTTSVQ